MKTIKEFLNFWKLLFTFILTYIYYYLEILHWTNAIDISRTLFHVLLIPAMPFFIIAAVVGRLFGSDRAVLSLNKIVERSVGEILLILYFYILSCLIYFIIVKIKNRFFPTKDKSLSENKKPINLIKKVATIFLLASLLYLVVLIMAEAINPRPKGAVPARIVADMQQMRTVAELIYQEEGSYENVNCNYGNIKLLCDDIEWQAGEKPTIHRSKQEYCAYSRRRMNEFFCIDKASVIGISNIYPGEEGYCDGKTFRCPEATWEYGEGWIND